MENKDFQEMQYSEDDNNELSVQFHFVYKSINMSFSKQNLILQGISLGHFISPEISCLFYIQKVDFFSILFLSINNLLAKLSSFYYLEKINLKNTHYLKSIY